MSTETAHATGFSSGVMHALWLDVDPDRCTVETPRPAYITTAEDIAAYNDGFDEGVEYVEAVGDDFAGIGSTDGIFYDQCVHRPSK